MIKGTLQGQGELATEFNRLSCEIHRDFHDEPNSYYRGKGTETLFVMTGRRAMCDEEFLRVMGLVDQCDLPILARCHAKYGGFIFALTNPSSSDEPEILFGFEIGQVPVKYRPSLRRRYSGKKNRILLGAYGEAKNVEELLPYLDTSHSKTWGK